MPPMTIGTSRNASRARCAYTMTERSGRWPPAPPGAHGWRPGQGFQLGQGEVVDEPTQAFWSIDGERLSTRQPEGYFQMMKDFIEGKPRAATYGSAEMRSASAWITERRNLEAPATTRPPTPHP